ncbi:MAG: 4a-hydroxytetrahydrobiopterin dehydratase [Candidatus Diapherotrites archaeon]|nr:4a-hydroxytetrahydrobiopterin dehydratase [Candidatus Diapherotrites archaeon]
MEKNGLAAKKCVPCQGGIPPIELAEAKKMLLQAKGWELTENGKKIEKKFVFKNFAKAMEFVGKVAKIAEQEGHHPDIFVSYNKVTITNYTHKIGGLHENDFILAAKIDELKK